MWSQIIFHLVVWGLLSDGCDWDLEFSCQLPQCCCTASVPELWTGPVRLFKKRFDIFYIAERKKTLLIVLVICMSSSSALLSIWSRTFFSRQYTVLWSLTLQYKVCTVTAILLEGRMAALLFKPSPTCSQNWQCDWCPQHGTSHCRPSWLEWTLFRRQGFPA